MGFRLALANVRHEIVASGKTAFEAMIQMLGFVMDISDEKIDLLNESDRGAVIVGAAVIEDELSEMLKSIIKANEVPERKIKEIFNLSGPLSSFSSKSLICYAFGYISRDVFDDLTKIRKLRNKFAHSTIKVDFLSNEIEKHVADMHCCKEAEKLFEGKRFNIKGSHKEERDPKALPPEDWEARAMGFVKYKKAVFCLGILILRCKIREHHFNHIKT